MNRQPALTVWTVLAIFGLVPCLQACGNTRLMIAGSHDHDATEGMDPKTFEVLDSSQVHFIEGLMMYGLGSIQGVFSPCGYGNLTGRPIQGSKFSQLSLGMTVQEALARAGQPDAQHVGLDRKPGFSFSPVDVRESYRLEMSYVNVGRLLFAYVDPNYVQLQVGMMPGLTRPKANCPGLRLKWVIYNAREPAGPLERDNAHLTAYSGPPPEKIEDNTPPGMNEFGHVVDPCRLARGPGLPVDGVGPTAGSISGKANADSKFNLLRLGMTREKAFDILGQPDGRSACNRFVFRGAGELEFSHPATGSERLTWIVHQPTAGVTK